MPPSSPASGRRRKQHAAVLAQRQECEPQAHGRSALAARSGSVGLDPVLVRRTVRLQRAHQARGAPRRADRRRRDPSAPARNRRRAWRRQRRAPGAEFASWPPAAASSPRTAARPRARCCRRPASPARRRRWPRSPPPYRGRCPAAQQLGGALRETAAELVRRPPWRRRAGCGRGSSSRALPTPPTPRRAGRGQRLDSRPARQEARVVGMTAVTVVCCSMISESQTPIGVGARAGRARATAARGAPGRTSRAAHRPCRAWPAERKLLSRHTYISPPRSPANRWAMVSVGGEPAKLAPADRPMTTRCHAARAEHAATGHRAAGADVPSRAVGGYVPGLTRKAFETFGFSAATLVTDWAAIVGELVAGCAAPERMKWPRGAGARRTPSRRPRPQGPALLLRVDPAGALDVNITSSRSWSASTPTSATPPLPSCASCRRRSRRLRRRRPRPGATPVAPCEAPELADIADERLRGALQRLKQGLTERAR